jgi:hypothetical protein
MLDGLPCQVATPDNDNAICQKECDTYYRHLGKRHHSCRPVKKVFVEESLLVGVPRVSESVKEVPVEE